MEFDWLAVAAMLFGFVVLIGVLKQFVLMPIFASLQRRERRYRAALARADIVRDAAEAERAMRRHRNEAFDRSRAAARTTRREAFRSEA